MVRYSLLLVVGLCSTGPAAAASWADAMFDGLSRDFGSVPRGPTLSHPFRITNKSDAVVHIAGVRVSCGCVTAVPLQNELAPGQTTAIVTHMDTRRFAGTKTVTIYVQFSRPHWEEVRLWVQANSRDDVMLSPDSLSFGQVKRGSSPTASTTVTFLGNGDWQIQEARSESNYVQTTIKEERRETTEVAYQLTARIRPDAPVGKWYSDIWLQTNNASTPRVRVPLTVEIESALSVSPASVVLGQIKAGAETERKVIVRGVRPFRITAVQGADAQVSVRASNQDSRQVHILTITLRAAQPGELRRTLRVVTDLKEEGEIEFQAKAEVLP
jgi:hypothetical protein